VTTVALDANSQILQSDVRFPTQTCRMVYQVVSGNVLGASKVKVNSDSSYYPHQDAGSVVGIVFCGVLIVGGLLLFIRSKIRHRRVAKLFKKRRSSEEAAEA
jgi:hypothetical protein